MGRKKKTNKGSIGLSISLSLETKEIAEKRAKERGFININQYIKYIVETDVNDDIEFLRRDARKKFSEAYIAKALLEQKEQERELQEKRC